VLVFEKIYLCGLLTSTERVSRPQRIFRLRSAETRWTSDGRSARAFDEVSRVEAGANEACERRTTRQSCSCALLSAAGEAQASLDALGLRYDVGRFEA